MATESYWKRNERITRRRFGAAAGLGGAGLAALALTGCGDDDDAGKGGSSSGATAPAGASAAATGATAAGQPKRGGQVNAAQPLALTDVYDPHTSLATAAQFFTLIGNVTTRPSIDATKLEPELVQKWEIPGDGTQINLTIREGVTWHNKPPTNGRAFTTDDLAFNLTRITGALNPDRKAAFQRASTLPNFESATAVDAKTVQVKLTKPHSGFLYGMSDWRNSLVPRDFVEKGGKFEDAASLVGTGPWIVESSKDQVKTVFKPNPNAWEKGKPYLEQFNWLGYGDVLSQQTAFGQGQIDYIASGNKATADTIKKIASNARVESWPFGNWVHLRFNTTKKPFDDARVRLGLFRLMDYKSWNDALYGEGAWDYTGPLSAAYTNEAISSADIQKLPGYNPATRDADIKAGKDMLAAAGFPEGRGLAFKIMPSSNTDTPSVRAQDDLRRALPEAKIEIDIPADFTIFSRRQVAGDWEMISYTLYPAPDAVIEMTNNTYSTGARNYGKFKEPQIDALIDKAATQLDTKQRGDTLREAQKLLIEQFMPTIHFAMPRLVYFMQPKLKGMEKFGGRIGGGSYDLALNLRNAWLEG